MHSNVPSRTAMTTSLIRAHHARTSADPLHVDPWGDWLVPESYKNQLAEWATEDARHSQDHPLRRSRAAVIDAYLESIPSYASVIFRARYAEDALARSVSGGVAQYVQIGAGFDSFSRRKNAAAELKVYEIDHPATQSFKRERLAVCATTNHVEPEYISADLAQESLRSALSRSSFSFGALAFMSWLGVSVYLSRSQNESALRSIASSFAPGSVLVFTYTDQRALDGSDQGFRRMQKNAASMGEPFLTGFMPSEMAQYLNSLGLDLLEDVNGLELASRYAACGHLVRTASRYSRLALAKVSGTSVET